MAQGIQFICGGCGKTIGAWDDGNPYYLDARGKKQYAYHPDHMRDQCIGNDSPSVCLSCGKEFMVDSRAPIAACPKCHSSEIADTFHLDGRTCPYCAEGIFVRDPDFFAIS